MLSFNLRALSSYTHLLAIRLRTAISAAGGLMKYIGLALCFASIFALPQTSLCLDMTPRPGTGVSVTLAEPVDSDHDAFGHEYQAVLTAPLELPNGAVIPAGARATISLIHNNSGWLTQLTSIVANGRAYTISSSSGSIIAPRSPQADLDAGLLIRIGLARRAPVTGRIQLSSSTQLRFFLIGVATPVRAAINRSPRSTPQPLAGSTSAIQAAKARLGRVSYLCRATDESGQGPNPYYVADVQQTLDNPALVERSWRQYLVTTYPYRFGNNPRATIHCTRLPNTDKTLQTSMNSEDAVAVHTQWRYTLGPPSKP